jgi:1-acyl-sn-glycerol-3-phosphate acyltransferase
MFPGNSETALTCSYALRLTRFTFHILRGLGICAVFFPFNDSSRRSAHIQQWSRRLLEICGVHCQFPHGEAAPHAMVVANHISWLDIFVINALHPCTFIAKAEVRRWPVLGWLAHRAGTLFLHRASRRDLHQVLRCVVDRLRRGERVAYFPEGTSAPHGAMLPFHPGLFEAAREAGVMVQPYALRYADLSDAPHRGVEYVGDTSFGESLARILSGTMIVARLERLPPIATGSLDRRALAMQAQGAVAAALAGSATGQAVSAAPLNQ